MADDAEQIGALLMEIHELQQVNARATAALTGCMAAILPHLPEHARSDVIEILRQLRSQAGPMGTATDVPDPFQTFLDAAQ